MYDAEYFFVDNPLNRYTLSCAEQAEAERRRLGDALPAEQVAG